MNRSDPPRLSDDRRWMTAPTLGGFAGAAAILVVVAVVVGSARHVLPESAAILLFLTSVLISAAGFGFWVGIASAFGALAGFNFMYVEPHFTLHIARPEDIIKLAVFLLAAAIIGLISGRLREQVDAANGRAAALEVLSQVSTELAMAQTPSEVAQVTVRHLHALADGPALALGLIDGKLHVLAAEPEGYLPDASELEAADVALRRGRVEFASAQGWSGSRLTFYPLGSKREDRSGPVVGHRRLPPDRRDHGWREQAIEVILRQSGQALERVALTAEAEAERRRATSEEMRAALLASLSHDLRTPLATILGSVTTLRELGATLPPAAQGDLLAAIEEEAERLARYVEKLLQLTRLQAGMEVHMTWVDAGDAATASVNRARRSWPNARIEAQMPPLPMIKAEAGLLEQAVFNLIENAVKYAPGVIRVLGEVQDGTLVLSVTDRGNGLPAPIAEWLVSDGMTRPPQGTGLGLPISKGIATALGGEIVARRIATGAVVEIRLPIPPDHKA
ncbi:DUF4118 domain-containing protein [Paracoccus laeviglucosivorans]|uniref:histidine kinase n=1 Tax=Paracoccus laeviglucosivorans TaxID=1197861 RepID=A0A521EI71_9RHOB|nr:DUF4118 domain-containing protein [Paracoccus laeviglucosivorans]SMO83606.1 Histidine kinase-, DNA gyrase B-, and HSP90-like ATPase [Paracoccus laeviglucosivorans]